MSFSSLRLWSFARSESSSGFSTGDSFCRASSRFFPLRIFFFLPFLSSRFSNAMFFSSLRLWSFARSESSSGFSTGDSFCRASSRFFPLRIFFFLAFLSSRFSNAMSFSSLRLWSFARSESSSGFSAGESFCRASSRFFPLCSFFFLAFLSSRFSNAMSFSSLQFCSLSPAMRAKKIRMRDASNAIFMLDSAIGCRYRGPPVAPPVVLLDLVFRI